MKLQTKTNEVSHTPTPFIVDERGDIFASIIGPFIALADWIAKNPSSKRLPKGFSFGDKKRNERNCFSSAQTYRNAWYGISEQFPVLVRMISDEENKRIDKAFLAEEAIAQAEGGK